MQKEEIQDLVYKYLNDTATLQEKEQLLNWYRAATLAEDVEWLASVNNEEQLLKASMLKYIKNQAGIERTAPAAKLWPRIAIAAAAVAAICFGIYLFNSRHVILNSFQDPALAINDIAPGKNTATLTLANGKTIHLSDAKSGVIINASSLKYNDNTVISTEGRDLSSLRSVEMTSLSTPRGGTYQITLPDGTRAWLNADSKISFPSQFTGKERKILLSGEAYFEVAKNKDKSFIAESEGQEVKVLGTHFNISAYKGEGIKTTLLEGSVRVLPLGLTTSSSLQRKAMANNEVILKPNQQSLVTENQNISIKQVDASTAIAWKNGKFMFESESIEQIMKMVERWYNVEVVYAGERPKDKFNGSVSRFDNISKVLEVLELTKNVHFKIEGRKITVSK